MTAQIRESVSAWHNSEPVFAPAEREENETIRVVLIDDDDDFREAVTGELEDMGFMVSAVADGDGLMSLVESGESLDVIIMDWRLQSCCGLDLLPVLRRRKVQAPVIFLTGAASTD